MSSLGIILLILAYLLALFFLAYWLDNRSKQGNSILKNPWIYSLSLVVYCTAWTYYGSVGKAATDGLSFLTIYIGPVVVMPIWYLIISRMISISKIQRITTLSDFISTRYNNSISLSILVSFLSIIGIIPYISIQFKSISTSFDILTSGYHNPVSNFLMDESFYLMLILAVFIILYAFRSSDTTDKHEGMVGAIALESVIKLIGFLCVGVFVTYFMFDGISDIFDKADFSDIAKFQNLGEGGGLQWFFLSLLSMSAFILLPRQFQMSVVENASPSHLRNSIWTVPLYMLVINLFVIPIALAGQILLQGSTDPDFYILSLPISSGQQSIALISFLGGFSAATSMIIVSTIALTTMVSHNIVLPIVLKNKENKDLTLKFPLLTRRIAVFGILFLAYLYFKFISEKYSIVSIGLISFTAISQFLPATLLGLFWKDGNKKGAISGIIVGFSVWFILLIFPTLVEIGLFPESVVKDGYFNLSWLKPESFLGLKMGSIANAAFWSLFLNTIFFAGISVSTGQTASERNMAEFFVDVEKYSKNYDEKLIWKGALKYADLIKVSESLLGRNRTKSSIQFFEEHYSVSMKKLENMDPKFVGYMERLFSGVVGVSSARLIISSISKEEEIEVDDLVQILKESSEISRLNSELQRKTTELKLRSEELENANLRLRNLDKEKDDFISTVTHELRTPLTSIKALVEILHDNSDIDIQDQKRFLNTVIIETDRMTRLINQVLDLEKLDLGSIQISKSPIYIQNILEEALESLGHLITNKKITVSREIDGQGQLIIGDQDRLKQVFINIISNAIKFVPEKTGSIKIKLSRVGDNVEFVCKDNGKGIEPESIDRIFDKFYQARDQTTKKPVGSGLGLSITKKIVELHDGSISVESNLGVGTMFSIQFPLLTKKKVTEYNEQ